MSKIDIAKTILNHPDKDEILARLISGVSPADISEGLCARYSAISEKKFALSTRSITTFQKDYLDFYSIIRDDAEKLKSSPEEQLAIELQNSPKYHKALEKYVDIEVDIKTMLKKMIINVETRVSQMYDLIQEDNRNIKMDRVIIEWLNLMITVLEKYDSILNPINPEQINIQNNINIQVVDDHINVVYGIIKNILEKLDYDTSILFIDMFNEEMKKLKSNTVPTILPQEERVAGAKILSETITTKLAE
jgi:hypothetical protein